jgi:4'-phosphopantetheinyl transferase
LPQRAEGVEAYPDQPGGVVRKPARVLLWLGQLDSAQPLPQPEEISAEEWRWCQDLAPARRRNYCHSRARLRAWLAELWTCAPLEVPLLSPPGKPPRLSGDQAFLSLSHSGDGLLLGLSAEPIGVDLEAAARPLAADALMRRFFPPAEVRQLQRLEVASRRQAVLTSWLLKEAAIKWRRSSLAAELREWQLDHGTGQLRHLRLGLEPEGRSGRLGPWGWAAVGAGVAGAQWMLWTGAG